MSGDKLRLKEKLAYGVGDFASCIYWAVIGTYLLKFYTDVFGISAAVAGAISLWSRIFDGVNDPMIGALADRTSTRWGKFRPYILFGCVPLAAAAVLAFTTPNLSTTGKIVWAAGTYNLIMILYTVVNIPYTALLGVISPDSAERTKVSSVKFVCAFAAGLFAKPSLPYLTELLGRGSLQLGYQLTLVVYGVIAVSLFLFTAFGTKERVKPPVGQKTKLGRDLKDLFTNGPWLILLAMTLPFILCWAIRGTIAAHYFDYYVGTQTVTLPFLGTHELGYKQLFGAFNVAGDAGAILGIMLVPFVAVRFGKRTTFVVLFVIALLTTLSYQWLRPEQVKLIIGLQFVGSMMGGPLSVLLWAMYADTADYAEWKRGRRATGLVFSAATMSQKVGWAVGIYFAGRMLTGTGYVANVAQTLEVLTGMKSMMGYLPAICGGVALVIFLFYPLNEKRVAEIEADLKARRIASGEEPAAS